MSDYVGIYLHSARNGDKNAFEVVKKLVSITGNDQEMKELIKAKEEHENGTTRVS